jgi:hypothetical protein
MADRLKTPYYCSGSEIGLCNWIDIYITENVVVLASVTNKNCYGVFSEFTVPQITHRYVQHVLEAYKTLRIFLERPKLDKQQTACGAACVSTRCSTSYDCPFFCLVP